MVFVHGEVGLSYNNKAATREKGKKTKKQTNVS
jgi:hypothetical protein